MLLSHEEITDVRFMQVFCQRNSTAAVEEYSYRRRYPRWQIPDRRAPEAKALFPIVNSHTERQAQRKFKEEEILLALYSKDYTAVHEEFRPIQNSQS